MFLSEETINPTTIPHVKTMIGISNQVRTVNFPESQNLINHGMTASVQLSQSGGQCNKMDANMERASNG